MIERPMPQDILKYKQKALGNFSAREIIFGIIGFIIIIYFCLNVFTFVEDPSKRAIYSAIPAVPFFLIGFLKIYGVPLEKIFIPIIYENVICPVKRLKEVHYPDYEKEEKTRYWLKEAEDSKKKKTTKITCKASKTYRAIK